jgi:hypothetical protein
MASMALAEAMLGRAFDPSALQWYLRTREEGVTSEMLDRMVYRAPL